MNDRRKTNAFIATVVAVQVLLPLRYYFGDDEFDERFAWRMFSPIRAVECTAEWTAGDPPRPVRLRDHAADVWGVLVGRARMDVVLALGRLLCDREARADERPAVRVDLRCPHPDGRVRRPVASSTNLCEVTR